jgi:hypothetical protein
MNSLWHAIVDPDRFADQVGRVERLDTGAGDLTSRLRRCTQSRITRLEHDGGVSMFRTTLHVSHLEGRKWLLTMPLVWEGRWQYLVVRTGFATDFASIPKPVQWLLDSGGSNAEAAVLHDAVWRESRRREGARVDPWHADGIFRRALRETGSPALTRGLMWFAVRLAAMVRGRFGRLGPPFAVKILQLAGIFVLGVLTAAVPSVVAIIGIAVYWVASWVVALVWQVFERVRLEEPPNWPWPLDRKKKVLTDPVRRELLAIVDKPRDDAPPDPSSRAGRLEALLATPGALSEEAIDALLV